jgi:56kDa selenium binding protein (SBP56)
MALELRPAHDPAKKYGFVGVVISVDDVSASIWLWHERDGAWAADKVVSIPTPPGPRPPPGDRAADTHDRVRADITGDTGTVTLRTGGKLYHIGVGRTDARTHVLMLVHDLDIRVINRDTGELIRALTLNPAKDYQPQPRKENDVPRHL